MQPKRMSRPTSASRNRPAKARVHEMKVSGHEDEVASYKVVLNWSEILKRKMEAAR
jgi:hypothetical protein